MSGMTFSSLGHDSDILPATVQLSSELLSEILHQITDIGDFSEDKEFLWNRHLMQLTGDIGKFVELTTLMSKAILGKKKATLPEIKESHIHLLFILKAMNQAQQKRDIHVLEDLIKYELKANLTQWKIDLIPQLKRLLNP